jgi:hypothetical protein
MNFIDLEYAVAAANGTHGSCTSLPTDPSGSRSAVHAKFDASVGWAEHNGVSSSSQQAQIRRVSCLVTSRALSARSFWLELPLVGFTIEGQKCYSHLALV